MLAMYMNHSHNLHTRSDYVSDNQIKEYLAIDGGLYDTNRVQAMSHVLQTVDQGFNYTHQQLNSLY